MDLTHCSVMSIAPLYFSRTGYVQVQSICLTQVPGFKSSAPKAPNPVTQYFCLVFETGSYGIHKKTLTHGPLASAS